MSAELLQAKRELRKQLRAKIQTLPAIQREQASAQACVLLTKQLLWQNAKIILFYAPLADELDIWPLIPDAFAANKVVTLPKFDTENNCYIACQIENIETDFLPGQFGIREPKANCTEIPLNRLDLTLVPGVGFDFMGARLGRGRGFYDRLLAQISETKCGVGFDEQIVEAIPTEPHDVHLNCILTPTRWHEVVG
jgi:5-formyltetrahydrofolate cyclo-ligase